MGGFFAVRCDPSRAGRRPRLKILGILVAFWSALAPSVVAAGDMRGGPSRLPEAADDSSPPARRTFVVGDVVLQPGGTLQGAVVAGRSANRAGEPVSGARISLIREGRVVARCQCDGAGRFAVSGLRGGKYVLAIKHDRLVEYRLCRVWTPEAAPPKADAAVRIDLGAGTVRGQGPLPALSFSEAALMGGLVVGAIAAPVIYHNAQKSNRVPASP